MRFPFHLSEAPGRIASGAFVLHSGIEKWSGSAETAQGVQAMASTAFPFLAKVPPTRFLKALAAGEIAVGALLVTPVVPRRVAGLALSGFSASLLAMYARVPGMRRPGSVWPTPQGIAVSKDVWLLGIGLGLLAPLPSQQ